MLTAVRQNADGLETLHRAAALLKSFIAESHALSLGALVRKIIVDTSYDLILLSLPNGRQRSRNVWKLVVLAEQNENLGCGEFARDLSLMREFDVKQADAPVDTQNAVKLMTIHASKGLEFPFVALPVLSTNAVHRKDRLLFHREYGLAFNTQRTDDDVKPTWYQAAKVLDDDMDIAERKRLFYVAVTRARDHLALFMEGGGRDNQSFRTWLISALEIDAAEFVGDKDNREITVGSDHARFSLRSNLHLVRHQSAVPLPLESASMDDEARAPEESGASDEFGASDECALANQSVTVRQPSMPMTDRQSPEATANNFQLIASADGQFKFVFSPVTEITEPSPPLESSREEPPRHDPFDLLAPIEARELPLPSAWQGNIRVTPRNNQMVVQATVMGTFFHALMQHLPPDGRAYSRDEIEDLVFAQHDIIPSKENIAHFVGEGEKLLQLFYASDFCRMFRSAKQRLHELPYLLLDGERGVNRRPDLLIEDADGYWRLIDFKTDHFDLSQINKQAKQHSEQLQNYVSELSKLLKLKISPHIYFAQHAVLVACSE